MDKKALSTKLQSGQNVYGTCMTSTSPLWPGVAAGCGIDFVFIDTEHIPLDRSALSNLCQHFRALNVTPIVRIPQPDPFLACQAIDGGAIGVVVPYLEKTEQLKIMAGAVKFRPLKGEVLDRVLNNEEVLSVEMESYIHQYNAGNLFIANIESVPAVDRLDELLQVPGLDAIFIGPHDLSVSMGLPEQYDHPEFEKVVKDIIHRSRKKGIHIGIHFSLEPERQIQWIKEGVNIVVHSFDIALFKQKLQSDLQIIRAGAGDEVKVIHDAGLVV